jgi:formate dehydrogenase major subunit
MVKKEGTLLPVSWDEALETIAARMRPLAGSNGAGVAAMASTRLPVEALSIFKQVFSDCMGSDMVTSLEEGKATAVVSEIAEEMGRPFEATLGMVKAADCVLAIGTDLGENHMVAGFLVKRNLPLGTKLIVVDPRENKLDSNANVALKAVTGADLDVLAGISAGLVKLGLAEGDGIAAERMLAQAAQATGISADDLLAAAAMIGVAEKPVILYGSGLTGQSALPTLRALIALGKAAGASLLSVKGEANSVAAAQFHMERPFQMNGHQAVYIAMGDDTPSQRLIQQIEAAPFLAIQASYASRLTAMADVVLPVQMWAEQEGHFINLEGRIQKANAALTAPAEVRSNADVLKALAEKLGIAPNENWEAALCARPAAVAIGI